jgi:hypothetical protein
MKTMNASGTTTESMQTSAFTIVEAAEVRTRQYFSSDPQISWFGTSHAAPQSQSASPESYQSRRARSMPDRSS